MPHIYIKKSKQVLLDANLLTMYLVAQLGNGEVEKFKRTRAYTIDDAVILNKVLLGFGSILTTPHILAETANLLDWFHSTKRQKLFAYLCQFIQMVDEQHLIAKQVIASPAFYKLGLSDATLFDLCHEQGCVLLTTDLDLYGFAVGYGLEAINFNHLREL